MNDVLTQDQIHSLFINLNKLADFQRRFLIGVESNASLPAEQQRFGHLFLLSVRSSLLFPALIEEDCTSERQDLRSSERDGPRESFQSAGIERSVLTFLNCVLLVL